MTTIYTRAGEGAPLTHSKVDLNFTNLRDQKCGTTTSTDGGAIIQATSKTTAVTLNNVCGTISMEEVGAIASNAIVSFTFNNNKIAATDVIVITHVSGDTIGDVFVQCVATGVGTATVYVKNVSDAEIAAQSANAHIKFRFTIIKATAG